jgi:hypothetical protein
MIANLLPPKVRRAIYIGMTTALALEIVWDIIPADFEGRLLQSAAALGFVLAASNTNTNTPEEG